MEMGSTTPLFPPPPTPTRPDHSALHLPSTTPSLSPPHSRSTTPRAEFSKKYGGFGSASYDPPSNGDDNLFAERKSSKYVGQPKSPFLVVCIFLLTFLGGLSLLSRYTVIPTPRVSQLLPTTFYNLMLGETDQGPAASHHIIPLIKSANDHWSTLLASQSTTFDKASRTYKSRYSLPPPPGFDKWFAFATKGRNHTLVDEYDSMMADLSPFRSLSPAELRRRTAELAKIPGISIISIRDGAAQVYSKGGKWAPALAFQAMIKDFVHDLPDMDVAINEKAEGRVLPRKQRTVVREEYGLEDDDVSVFSASLVFSHFRCHANNRLRTDMTDPMINPTLEGFKPEWDRDGSVWESFRRSCPTDSPSRRLVESIRSAESNVGLTGLPVKGRPSIKIDLPVTRRKSTGLAIPPARELMFSSDIDGNYDVCARPSVHSLHSAFFSDQRSIGYLYPVFSPSKPSGFSDILIPSHHYWSPSSETTYEWDLKRGSVKEPTDIPWEEKLSTIYWRGKVTRGADTPPGHAGSFQKQRLVKMANDATAGAEKVLVAFNDQTGSLTSTAAPLSLVNKAISDIAMACVVDFGECAYLRSLGYRVEPPGPLSESWKHKYVLDLDEIGFSPKFLALMESKSAVVKSSMQKEFWKGWIVPWFVFRSFIALFCR